MERILLAIDRTENQRLVAGLLSPDYDLYVVPPGSRDLGGRFDLAVLDAGSLSRLRPSVLARRAEERPVFLPVLVVTARNDLSLASAYLKEAIDELVIAPVEKVELLARVEILLRTRRLSRELERRVEEADLADRRKDEFLATLAHELRNPLAPIRNSVEVLKLAECDPELVAGAREVMERQLAQMVRLIDDLLDVSRISQDKLALKRQPVELGQVVAAAIEASRPLVAAAGHELSVAECAVPVRLNADPARLTQVVSNLINNAAKYTPPGGRIRVSTERNGRVAAVRVRDSGVGLAPDMLSKVFDLFTQVDSSIERSQGGLGIGLTLVRRLVEMHGGTVEATSPGPGEGSEFVVRLPVAADVEQPADVRRAPPRAGARGPSRRVLLVDDNVDAAKTLAMLLKMLGHQVETVHDGPTAVEAAAARPPEVVFCDIGLPGMSGYEVARRLRRDSASASTVLVAVTGYGQDEDRQKSREAGFDHHLVKPVKLDELTPLLAAGRRDAR